MARAIGVVMMTALVPTKGHEYLIEFASNFLSLLTDQVDSHEPDMENFLAFPQLHIIIPSRSQEPVSGEIRLNIIQGIIERIEEITGTDFIIHLLNWDEAPQDLASWEGEEQDFWHIWGDRVIEMVPREKDDLGFFFASETYGKQMAEVLNMEFISADANREVVPVRGTDTRRGLTGFAGWNLTSEPFPPETCRLLGCKVVFFGAESVGKTTMAKKMAAMFDGKFYPEWARQFLETAKVPCDEKSMAHIAVGQAAQEMILFNDPPMRAFMDTNLLSTLGYHRLSGIPIKWDLKESMDTLVQEDNEDGRTLYILLNNDCPFTPDPLRFGGDKRETTTEFWQDLLAEYDLEYRVVTGDSWMKREQKTKAFIVKWLKELYGPIMSFKR